MAVSLTLGDTHLIINMCKSRGLLRNQAAYVLATAFHETAGTMRPVRETLAKTDAKAKEILTKAWKSGKLSWVKSDYWSSGFFGRGYVQLTHQANYQKAGNKLGVDLVSNPSLALDATYAVPILVLGMEQGWFTGKKLTDYITLSKSDFTGARRIVNGTDRAGLIAGYAKEYDAALKQEGYGETPVPAPVETPTPAPAPVPATTPQPAPAASAAGFWAILASIFGRKKP
jgi:predicted chitinase